MIIATILCIIGFIIIKRMIKSALKFLNCSGEILSNIVNRNEEEIKEPFDWYQDKQRDEMESKAKSNSHIS